MLQQVSLPAFHAETLLLGRGQHSCPRVHEQVFDRHCAKLPRPCGRAVERHCQEDPCTEIVRQHVTVTLALPSTHPLRHRHLPQQLAEQLPWQLHTRQLRARVQKIRKTQHTPRALPIPAPAAQSAHGIRWTCQWAHQLPARCQCKRVQIEPERAVQPPRRANFWAFFRQVALS